MGVTKIFAGMLNHRIEIYLNKAGISSATGETAKSDELVGPISCMLEDGGGNENEDGKIYYLSSRVYTIRFVEDVWKKGEQMFVRDQDGDYEIYSVELIGKKEFLKLKTSKRE